MRIFYQTRGFPMCYRGEVWYSSDFYPTRACMMRHPEDHLKMDAVEKNAHSLTWKLRHQPKNSANFRTRFRGKFRTKLGTEFRRYFEWNLGQNWKNFKWNSRWSSKHNLEQILEQKSILLVPLVEHRITVTHAGLYDAHCWLIFAQFKDTLKNGLQNRHTRHMRRLSWKLIRSILFFVLVQTWGSN